MIGLCKVIRFFSWMMLMNHVCTCVDTASGHTFQY